MSAGHTPGPWEVVDYALVGGNGQRVCFSAHAGIQIGGLPATNPDDAMMMAAPCMYGALAMSIAEMEAIRPHVGARQSARLGSTCDHLRRIMERARGETPKGETK